MSSEKRNIATKLETQSKYLSNILDKNDVKEFKKLIPELQDTWHKKQMFRTETEMRFSVLSDNTENLISVSVRNICFFIQVS